MDIIDVDLTQLLVVQADWFTSRWNRVPIAPLQQALSRNEAILMYDLSARRQQLLTPQLLEEYVDKVNPDQYPYMVVWGPEEPEWNLPPMMYQLLRRFHYSWYNVLRPFLYSTTFHQILSRVYYQRASHLIYPDPDFVFSAYLSDLSKIRCVFLGPEPYGNPHANGKFLATDQKETTDELWLLQQAFRTGLNLGLTWSLDKSLVTLSTQGVFLGTYSLTTQAQDYWLPFLHQIISVLNSKTDLIWILFGRKPQSIASLISPQHTVYCLEDPAWYVQHRQIIPPDIFSQLQDRLNLIL